MADKTFGVKVSEELFDKVKLMIDDSGLSSKEWFEKAIALTTANSIKQDSIEYSQDLKELEVHTTRIYELVANVVHRSIYLKEAAVKEVSEELSLQKAIIAEWKQKVAIADEDIQKSHEIVAQLGKENNELSNQLHDQRSVNDTNQSLISEYKEKIDTLSGLVTKFQSYQEENELLKVDVEKLRTQMKLQAAELMQQNDDQQSLIDNLCRDIEQLNITHKNEMERLEEKKEFEKEKALLEREREFQKQILEKNEDHNRQIKNLYEELTDQLAENKKLVEQSKKVAKPKNQTETKS